VCVQQETYLAHAQKYDQHLETSLSKRVREWEDKLKPLLHEQDNRPYFNVRQYGQGVLDKFEEKGIKTKGKLTLKDVVGEEAQVYEVIRTFMASLHLVSHCCFHLNQAKTSLTYLSLFLFASKGQQRQCGNQGAGPETRAHSQIDRAS